MIRAQIQFDEGQYEQIRKLAHRQHISIARAVRLLVRRGMNAPDVAEEEPSAARLLDIAGIARGGPKDLGRRHDEYLDADADA